LLDRSRGGVTGVMPRRDSRVVPEGATARRTVVGMSLTAYLPSASLSERDIAVARIRGAWRVWSVPH